MPNISHPRPWRIQEALMEVLREFECTPEEAKNLCDDAVGDFKAEYESRAEAAWEAQQQSLAESGGPDDSAYRRQMHEAGRGHLLRLPPEHQPRSRPASEAKRRTEMTKVGTLQVTDGCEYDRPGEWVVEEFGYGQHDEPSWAIPGWFEDRWGESGFFPSKAKAVEFMEFLAA